MTERWGTPGWMWTMPRPMGMTLIVGLLVGAMVLAARPRATPEPPAAGQLAARAGQRDARISFYDARVARDSMGARDRAVLAALLLERSKSTGNVADLERAEALARHSAALRGRRNESADLVLAGVLLAEHRFAEAYDVTRRLLEADSTAAGTRASLGEIALELGRYSEADRLFGSVAMMRTSTAVAPRYARWLELNGRSREAMTLLEQFRAALDSGFRVPPEQLAWVDLRLGDLAARNGRPDLARQAYNRGLSLVPEDPRLLAGLARIDAAGGDWAGAIDAGERATGQLLDPATLALLSDAWTALGDTARAGELARAMEVATSRQAGPYHRAWSLFLLDHGLRVPDVIARARAELTTRQDIYGEDLLAWALHRGGRDSEAWPHAMQALARGTRDGLLHYHAGMIALGLGDTARARTELDSALAINPRFHHFQADSARRLRHRLGGAE